MSEPTAMCRHCGEPLRQMENGDWCHERLYRCQSPSVSYGHNAAHPDVPCAPGGGNPCRCTYNPDPPGSGASNVVESE